MSEIDDKIEAHAGYGMRTRSRLDRIANEVELELRRFGNETSNKVALAAKLGRAIFGVDLRINNEIKSLSDAQIADMTLRAEGCLMTLKALEDAGYIHAKKGSYFANMAATILSK